VTGAGGRRGSRRTRSSWTSASRPAGVDELAGAAQKRSRTGEMVFDDLCRNLQVVVNKDPFTIVVDDAVRNDAEAVFRMQRLFRAVADEGRIVGACVAVQAIAADDG